jgi:hypothetical protein
MRNNVIVSLLVVVLFVLTVMSTGCGQPGKTAAEVNRDHVRKMQINNQQMMRDIDRTLDMDQPSKLTERHLP